MRVLVTDGKGRGVSGAQVELSSELTERQGWTWDEELLAWRTSHPAWIDRDTTTHCGVTDASGTLVIDALRRGQYLLFATMPRDVLGDGDVIDPSLLRPQRIAVTHAGQILVVDMFDRVWTSIHAVDAMSGIPLRRMLISSPRGLPGQIVAISGSHWDGWLPIEWNPLHVGSPGYQEASLELPPSRSEQPIRVELWPSDPDVIVIQNATEDLEGAIVELEAVRRVGEAIDGHSATLWKTKVAIREGRLTVGWPLEREFLIRIHEFDHRGRSWRSVPDVVTPFRPNAVVLEKIIARD
ncbi:MAG: hypothetical protein AB1793_09520 [Candidatus Thermoplasmatota archaeon]